MRKIAMSVKTDGNSVIVLRDDERIVYQRKYATLESDTMQIFCICEIEYPTEGGIVKGGGATVLKHGQEGYTELLAMLQPIEPIFDWDAACREGRHEMYFRGGKAQCRQCGAVDDEMTHRLTK
jgi:hypothetical protein